MQMSKAEKAWLKSLGIPNDKKHRQVKIACGKTYFVVDGYDPETRTVYEFNGSFWHGNPDVYDAEEINETLGKTFGELYGATLKKEKMLRKYGYGVVTKWEG